jgi:hypothetical protein
MRSDNKVYKLATVCLHWQQWIITSVWFDEIGISVFHSCAVSDLWQPLSEWCQLLSEGVLVCSCKNVGKNITFLVKFGKSGKEIREMLVQVYMDTAKKKTEVYKQLTHFSEGGESVTNEERSRRPGTSRTKKALQ